MQTTQQITRQQLDDVVDEIFKLGEVTVKEASSSYDAVLREFPDSESLKADLNCSGVSRPFLYAIYYPDVGGHVYDRRIELIPEKCEGHTHRFSYAGWGLIQLQCRFHDDQSVECRIAVNSEVRASNWRETSPDMGDPALWDWKVVKSKAGRLTRLLRKLGKESAK